MDSISIVSSQLFVSLLENVLNKFQFMKDVKFKSEFF